MRSVRLALAKILPEKWDLPRNWEMLKTALAEIAPLQPDLVCTPECYLDGYVTPEEDWTPERFREIAQEVGKSPILAELRYLIREMGCYCIFGCTEKVGESFYNAALLLNRQGELQGRYYKTHLQSHDLRYTPGPDLPVFDLDFGRIGILICADRRWPETARTLRVRGAELIMNPTYGMWHEANEWWMRTRAYENEVFYAFAHPRVAFIANPRGDLVAKLQSDLPAMLIHDIDLDEITDQMFRDRRPDIYQPLTEPED